MSSLPYPNPDTFIGAFEKMDLSDLRDKQFLVAINRGSPDDPDFICRTVHGPFTLSEMAEEVGYMWEEHMHHAHVTILTKSREEKAQWLPETVIDYIEQHYKDIVTDEFLGNFTGEFTCRAQILDSSSAPPKKEEENA